MPVEHEGLLVKFPFDAQKTSYDWWDGTLERTVPIEYVATEEVAGITTYKYEQTIPATKVGETEAPASVLGEPDEGNLTADNMYSNVRTLWAEPNTGVIIKRVEQQNSTLDYDGTTRVTTTEVTTGYDDATIQANADEYGPKGSLLHLLRAVLPWLLPVVGLLLVVLGLLLTFRGRTRASPRVTARPPRPGRPVTPRRRPPDATPQRPRRASQRSRSIPCRSAATRTCRDRTMKVRTAATATARRVRARVVRASCPRKRGVTHLTLLATCASGTAELRPRYASCASGTVSCACGL